MKIYVNGKVVNIPQHIIYTSKYPKKQEIVGFADYQK